MKDRIDKLHIRLENIDNILFSSPKSKKINYKRFKNKLKLLGKNIAKTDNETKRNIKELREILRERMNFINMVQR